MFLIILLTSFYFTIPTHSVLHTLARNENKRLQVLPNATKEEINKAYKKMVTQLHPDKNRAPGSEGAFQALVGAKTALLASRRK